MHFYPVGTTQSLRKSKYGPKRNHSALMLRFIDEPVSNWYRSYTVLKRVER